MGTQCVLRITHQARNFLPQFLAIFRNFSAKFGKQKNRQNLPKNPGLMSYAYLTLLNIGSEFENQNFKVRVRISEFQGHNFRAEFQCQISVPQLLGQKFGFRISGFRIYNHVFTVKSKTDMYFGELTRTL